METTTRYFVADLVSEVGSLPSVATQIVTMTADPQCDIGDLCRLIQSDSVMTMRFLALANSAAVSGAHETRDLRGALVRLGLRRVRNVSLFMGMHDMNPVDKPSTNLDMKEFWKYCLASASCAQGLAWQKGLKNFEDAWLVGILHGIGITTLDQQAPEGLQASLALSKTKMIDLMEAEMLVLDFHHGELASRVLRQWGLPPVFSEVIEFQPEPFEKDEVSAEGQELIDVLTSSIDFVRAFKFGSSGNPLAPPEISELAGLLNLGEPALEALALKVDREVADLSQLVGLDLDNSHFQEALSESKRQAARLGLEGFEDTMAKEKLEEELAVARDIQQHLLPQVLPTTENLEIAAVNHPSRQVSGDYYDFIPLKEDHLGLVIADVCGKGMPAALLASNLQASLRALGQVFSDPGELLAAVNNALFQSTDPERFATLFFAVLHPDGNSFQYCSAGHNPPLLLRQSGEAEWLPPAGTPLGMFADMKYPVMDVKIHPGDLLITYTDGITEAIDWQGTEFEESGLESVIRYCAGKPCPEIVERVIHQVLAHVGGESATAKTNGKDDADIAVNDEIDAGDDLTMVIFRRSKD